jgi:hypothetical protein
MGSFSFISQHPGEDPQRKLSMNIGGKKAWMSFGRRTYSISFRDWKDFCHQK